MPKIGNKYNHTKLLLKLGESYDYCLALYTEEQKAIGGWLPVGGGAWMDTFFKTEGLRAVIRALRNFNTSVEEAIEQGKQEMTMCVKKWNEKREYQVHYWDQHGHDWLENLVRRLR